MVEEDEHVTESVAKSPPAGGGYAEGLKSLFFSGHKRQ